LEESLSYKDGIPDEAAKRYYQYGQLQVSVRFKDGEPVGLWKMYMDLE